MNEVIWQDFGSLCFQVIQIAMCFHLVTDGFGFNWTTAFIFKHSE